MRPSRMLRNRKAKTTPPEAPPIPEGYRHSQTDGWASTERASARRFEHGEHDQHHDMPIVFGFTPNPTKP